MKQIVVYKLVSQKPFETCISRHRYEQLWTLGMYELLGEECLMPNCCSSCMSNQRHIEKKYRVGA